jgi:hypothetical protein
MIRAHFSNLLSYLESDQPYYRWRGISATGRKTIPDKIYKVVDAAARNENTRD